MLSRTSVWVFRTIVPCVLLSLAFAWLSPVALADGLSSTTTVGAGGSAFNLCFNSNSNAPLSKSTCSGSWSADGGALFGAGSAQSFAEYGVLGASATASATTTVLGGEDNGTQSGGQATWDDTLSFTGVNQPAALEAVISLVGTSVANCFPGSALCGGSTVNYTANFDEGGGPIINCEVITVGSCTMSLAINAQSAVDFSGFLGVNTGVTVTGVGPGSETTSVSYYDTAMVDSLLIVDANGNPVSGAAIVSASGTDYNALSEPPVSTPEPSSLGMLGLGVLGLIGLRKRATV